MSAYWKIPLQALVLLVGVGVFMYYQFVRPPLLYNPAHEAAVVAARGAEYDDLQRRYAEAFTLREEAALAVADASGSGQQPMELFLAREQKIQELRGEALAMVVEETNESSTDENYIILFWIHFLAINLFLGSWVSRDSIKYNIPKIFSGLSLILIYFIGPIGLVVYWFVRVFFAKKLSLHD